VFLAAARLPRFAWTPPRLRALKHGVWIGAVSCTLTALLAVGDGRLGDDAHAYWAAWRNGVYSSAPGQSDAFLYSPVFAQVVWPLTLLPWPLFFALWASAAVAVYAWLLAPLGRAWATPLLLMCLPEILYGNVYPYFALVAVFGLRRPALWALPLLTKITPAVGIAWFATRREWGRLAVALGTAAALAAVSYMAAPGLWAEWARLLLHPDGFSDPTRVTAGPLLLVPPGLILALGVPVSVGLTVFAARTNRAWLLPIAMVLASTVFRFSGLAVLAAIPRLVVQNRPARGSSGVGSCRAGRPGRALDPAGSSRPRALGLRSP
jgi:glycosyl transferase family 87